MHTIEQKPEQTSCENELENPASNQDSAWKEILELYFPKMMEFFYPEIYQKIDWTQGFISLDQELQQVVRQAIVGKRFVDKLFRVFAFGQEAMVLIHAEIQGQPKINFEERLFEYSSLLYPRYKQPVLTLVLLIDPASNWRPTEYRSYVLGLPVHHFQFYPVKLLDYRGQESVLEASDNPFAWITLVQLALIKTRNNRKQRLISKLSLVRLLYERKWKKKEILNLCAFIDWVLALPEELENIYTEELRQIEEKSSMPLMTNIERRAIERGIEKGLQMGLEQGLEQGLEKEKRNTRMIAKRMLEEGVDLSIIQRATELSYEELLSLANELKESTD
jgi:predicted transposase/invertase (TIGR01784 family)